MSIFMPMTLWCIPLDPHLSRHQLQQSSHTVQQTLHTSKFALIAKINNNKKMLFSSTKCNSLNFPTSNTFHVLTDDSSLSHISNSW